MTKMRILILTSVCFGLVLLISSWFALRLVMGVDKSQPDNITGDEQLVVSVDPTAVPSNQTVNTQLDQQYSQQFSPIYPSQAVDQKKLQTVERLSVIEPKPEATRIQTFTESVVITNEPTPSLSLPTNTPHQELVPSQLPSPTNTANPDKPVRIQISTEGSVTQQGNSYLFNQWGGSPITNNLLTLVLPESTAQICWLNFRLKVDSVETLAGFDDPCFVVILNGVPQFGIGYATYQQLLIDEWLHVSLQLPMNVWSESTVNPPQNSLVFMAGENGDLAGRTSIELRLEEFTNQPLYTNLQAKLPAEFALEQHRGYFTLSDFNQVTALPFMLSKLQAVTQEKDELQMSLTTNNQLRWQSNLFWFKDSLIHYGYLLANLEALPLQHTIVPLGINQSITVLPKQN